jgi:hypothetical protein
MVVGDEYLLLGCTAAELESLLHMRSIFRRIGYEIHLILSMNQNATALKLF